MPIPNIPVMLSCPQQHYRMPGSLSSPAELNALLSEGIHRYRRMAFEEHQEVNAWVMSRLVRQARYIQSHEPEYQLEFCLKLAREQLHRECAIRFGHHVISNHILLSVGVPAEGGLHYVDFDAYPIPHQPLCVESCQQHWSRLLELQQNFVEID